MSQLRLGPCVGQRGDLSLPIDCVGETIGILGIKGSGKTYTASVLVEEFLKKHVQVVVYDPLDVCWGLTSSANGRDEGMQIVVLGGDHAHLPLDARSGVEVANFVVDQRQSVVLVPHGTKSAQRQFITDFAERLFYRKGETANRTPLHVMIDEADLFCLSADTELLTKAGWTRYDDIKIGDLAVCFDLASNQYSYGKVSRVIVRQYAGKMINLKTKSLDCLVTPEHRVVLKRVQRAVGRYKQYPWTVVRADQVPTCIGIPSGGSPCGVEVPNVSNNEFRILGWLLTDGGAHSYKKRNVKLTLEQGLFTTKGGKQLSREMNRLLMTIPGVTRYQRTRKSHRHRRGVSTSIRWYFGGSSSEKFLRLMGGHVAPKTIRRIPRNILENASTEQLRALWVGLVEGDGSFQNGQWRVFYPGLNSGLADDFQELSLKLGLSTVKSLNNSTKCWVVSIASTRKCHWLRRRKIIDYSGPVWDITVPTGAFVARRNGRIFVTGNCPQRVFSGAERMLGAVDDLVRRGRSRGIGTTLVTQRSASINKDVLTQLDTLVVHRIVGPHDRKAIAEWIETHDVEAEREELLSSLSGLVKGEAWVWSPLRHVFSRVKIRRRETYDSSSTPKLQAATPPRRFTKVDLERLKTHLASVVAEAENNDPRKLQQKVAVLSSKLKQLECAPVTPAKAAPDSKATKQLIVSYSKRLESARRTLDRLQRDYEKAAQGLQGLLPRFSELADALLVPAITLPSEMPVPSTSGRPSRSESAKVAISTGSGRARMLQVLAIASRPLKDEEIGLLTDIRHRGGTFATYRRQLQAAGLIQREHDGYVITDDGRRATPEKIDGAICGEGLLDYYVGRLGGGGRSRILQVIARVYPKSLSISEIEELSDIHGGTLMTYVRQLTAAAIIVKKEDRTFQLHELLTSDAML